ncbi:MAG: hypothetical protein GY751_19085 [Bacteroidetes bacterium]|nr:hypothetical protein [Bacteroidota bacterium]
MKQVTNIKIKSIVITMMIAGVLMSCNTEESCVDLGTCPETSLIERIDIVIDGALSIADHQVEEVTGVKDGPVDYNFYGNPSVMFDFIIELSSGHTLEIKMHDGETLNPWKNVDVPYNIYPSQDFEDKLQYITADLRTGSDVAAYSSNLGSEFPFGIKLDVFRIISNNGSTIQCRIRDLELFKNTDGSQRININGTFVASIAFDADLTL